MPRGNPKGNPQNLKPFTRDDPRHYGNWVKTLTPEQRQQHLLEAERKATIKQAMKAEIERLQKEWIDKLQMAAGAVLHRATVEGDPAAFTAIWDRVIGRPETIMDIKVEQDDSADDIMKKLQAASLAESEASPDKPQAKPPRKSKQEK
jgi:hypothetical protein